MYNIIHKIFHIFWYILMLPFVIFCCISMLLFMPFVVAWNIGFCDSYNEFKFNIKSAFDFAFGIVSAWYDDFVNF